MRIRRLIRPRRRHARRTGGRAVTTWGARLHVLTAIIALAVVLAACSEPEWRTSDIRGQFPALQFRLTGESGSVITEDDMAGRIVLLFFGYTSCPDVCPGTLARLSRVMQRLTPAQREDTRVLFVSVDPRRDSPQRLARYTSAFGEGFIGLTAGTGRLRELAARYYTTFSYGEPDAEGNYPVSHNGSVFVFDRDGTARLRITANDAGGVPSDSVEAITADLQRLLASG